MWGWTVKGCSECGVRGVGEAVRSDVERVDGLGLRVEARPVTLV